MADVSNSVAEDFHPDVNEIKPYVAIGPNDEFSITVHKETFDSTFIIFTIVFGLALLIIVGITIFFAYKQSELPPPPHPLIPLTQEATIHSNIGAAVAPTSVIGKNLNIPEDGSALTNRTSCESIPTTIWNGTKCECKPPFFGPTCSREKHNNKYYAVGIPDEDRLYITITDETTSKGKSFSTNKSGSNESCSNLCDNTAECIGFIYHPSSDFVTGTCTLLKGEVFVPRGSGISYSKDLDSTLYMKSSNNLNFDGRIFLGEFAGAFPPRYWLVRETSHYKQLVLNEITTVKFSPTYAKIYGNHTGIYCLHSFYMSDVNIILKRGETSECYIHHPGTEIKLPPDWKHKTPIYVMYMN